MKKINLITILSLALLISACETPFNVGCITPEGNVETRTVTFNDFDKIEIKIDADVFITEGDTQEVVIESQSNVIDRIIDDSSVRNDELNLEINGCISMANNTVIVRITMPSLTGLQITSDGLFETVGIFENISDLMLDIRGDGVMDLQLGAIDQLSLEIDGDGRVTCTGTAEMVDIEINGDGRVNYSDLPTGEMRVKIDGDGACDLNVTESLVIDINGDGNIRTSGTAATQEIKIKGDGNIDNFALLSQITDIEIIGDGDCEISVSDELIIRIVGDGEICYKGTPVISSIENIGGTVKNCD